MRVRSLYRRKPGSHIVAGALAGVLLVAAPIVAATAQERRGPPVAPPEESPEQIARDAIERMMRALSQAIQNLPQYEMPAINEHGDIIIKRKNPPPQPPPRRAPDDENSTRT